MKKMRNLLKRCKSAFYIVGFFSLLINLFMLTVPLYMLQLFDRVIASQSAATLIYLTLIAIVALMVLTALEILRGRILNRVAAWLDVHLNSDALPNAVDNALLNGKYNREALADIQTIRGFLTSSLVFALFDAPWIFIYLAVIFLFSVTLGVIALCGALILFALTIINEKSTRESYTESQQGMSINHHLTNELFEHKEYVQGSGFTHQFSDRFNKQNQKTLFSQTQLSDKTSIISNIAKFVRMGLQIAMLGTGAYLIIRGHLTPGVMIASSIIMARALAPIEQVLGSWRNFLNARSSYKRLNQYLDSESPRKYSIDLPKPSGFIQIDNLSFAPQSNSPAILQNIKLSISAGKTLAIIGPSGAGKTTLARLIVGLWPPSVGSIRLDGAEIYHWDPKDIGHHIRYLPQEVSLFKANIKENIATFNIDDSEVVRVAQLFNIHQAILKMLKGYETDCTDFNIPAGLKQRILLARTFYNNPTVMIFDEPENHLDQDGVITLENALKKSNATKVVITNKPSLAGIADQVLVLNQGQIQSYGRTDQILKIWQGAQS